MKIPIGNVYYLLCYAWDRFEEGDSVDLGSTPPTRIQDLLSHVLTVGVSRIIRRGLHREYVVEQDRIRGIRGKLLVSETVKQRLLIQGNTFCEYTGLEHDVLHNRIIKSTLGSVCGLADLDPEIRRRALLLHQRMGDVAELVVRPHMFRRVGIHRNNQIYGFVLSVCRMIAESLLVDESSGNIEFKDLREDDVRMWQVFQDFVGNFFKREQSAFDVSAPTIKWRKAQATESDLRMLPAMRTDIVLQSPERTIIIDTKFYEHSVQQYHGVARLISAHLYQVLSYLENWDEEGRAGGPVEGMLLYPLVDDPHRLDYILNGHRVRVITIDLSQPWQQIHADMIGLVTNKSV